VEAEAIMLVSMRAAMRAIFFILWSVLVKGFMNFRSSNRPAQD
jgi:hypothetical protein